MDEARSDSGVVASPLHLMIELQVQVKVEEVRVVERELPLAAVAAVAAMWQT